VPPTPIASIVNAPESLPCQSSTHFPALDAAQAEAANLLFALHQRIAVEPDDPGPGLLRRLLGRGSHTVEPVLGVYLWGGVGRGKTYLMDWFVDELPLPGKRRLHFHHFMRAVHQAMAGLPRTPDPLEVVADQWRQDVRVLCLDEFVVTDIADAMILHRLLRALFGRGMTLVTTSNTHPQDLYRNGLQHALFRPAIELLERHTRVLKLDGGVDYRLRTLTEAGVWLDASRGDGPMAARFRRLTGGHAEHVLEFSANGRIFPVRGLGTDVVWFDFEDLCGSPRSAADYIEIAREYHTVLLSNLPRLTPANEAAARRLVHLIDELYDQRVKLVVSAEVALDQLYAGGLHDFPQERLLSRLTEMQSTGYLAERASDADHG
jgi:cell division protein ZapE